MIPQETIVNKDTIFTLTKKCQLDEILESNRRWAQDMESNQPQLFRHYNAKGQEPHTLFIGCSDSRYNEDCLGVLPGEVFTLKSVANICKTDDQSLLATLEFAILNLKINKIILCGHTDCGGIKACLTGRDSLLEKCPHLYHHLDDIEELVESHEDELNKIGDICSKSKLLSHKNVERQLSRILEIDVVKQALKNSQVSEEDFNIYGLVYNVDTGLVDVVEEVYGKEWKST